MLPADLSQFCVITTPITTNDRYWTDYQIFKYCVNMGIDSHLEGFTKSTFGEMDNCKGRFVFNFHRSELHILIRRLYSMYVKAKYNADKEILLNWIEDIKETEHFPVPVS